MHCHTADGAYEVSQNLGGLQQDVHALRSELASKDARIETLQKKVGANRAPAGRGGAVLVPKLGAPLRADPISRQIRGEGGAGHIKQCDVHHATYRHL